MKQTQAKCHIMVAYNLHVTVGSSPSFCLYGFLNFLRLTVGGGSRQSGCSVEIVHCTTL